MIDRGITGKAIVILTDSRATIQADACSYDKGEDVLIRFFVQEPSVMSSTRTEFSVHASLQGITHLYDFVLYDQMLRSGVTSEDTLRMSECSTLLRTQVPLSLRQLEKFLNFNMDYQS